MDYTAMDFWWKVIITVLNFGIGVYLWYERREDKTSGRIGAITTAIGTLKTDMDARMDDTRTRLAKMEIGVGQRLTTLEKIAHPENCQDLEKCCMDITQRVATVEERTRGAPSHGDLARLHARIDDVTGIMKRIEGESTAQTRILNLVYESLIDKRKTQ